MSDYPPHDPRNRPRRDRYPQEDREPPGRDRYDPYEENYRDDVPRRRVGGMEVPDLRRRSSLYGSGREEQYEDDYELEEGRPRRQGFLGFSGWDWIFFLALVFAAFRGTRQGAGCLPGRGCINTLLLNITGILLIFGAIYVNETSSDNGSVATALGALGCGACVFGFGGVLLLLWATVRLIDFSGIDDGGIDDGTGGLLGSILGRFN